MTLLLNQSFEPRKQHQNEGGGLSTGELSVSGLRSHRCRRQPISVLRVCDGTGNSDVHGAWAKFVFGLLSKRCFLSDGNI